MHGLLSWMRQESREGREESRWSDGAGTLCEGAYVRGETVSSCHLWGDSQQEKPWIGGRKPSRRVILHRYITRMRLKWGGFL